MVIALIIVAMILFTLAACNVPTGPVNIGWLGLAFFAGSFVVGKF